MKIMGFGDFDTTKVRYVLCWHFNEVSTVYMLHEVCH